MDTTSQDIQTRSQRIREFFSSWPCFKDKDDGKEENPSPLSFIPTELGTLAFCMYRVAFNGIWFKDGKYKDTPYLSIGHALEFMLCIAAIILHGGRLYKHFPPIYEISWKYKKYLLLTTWFCVLWMVGTSLQFYVGRKIYGVAYGTRGGEFWYVAVILLSILAAMNQIVSYYLFEFLLNKEDTVNKKKIQWFTWWIDIPLIVLNITVSVFLIIERDVWVSIWMGDLAFHFSEFVYIYIVKQRAEERYERRKRYEAEQAAAQNEMATAQSASVDSAEP